MWYVILGEAVVIVALWGAWRAKRSALATVTDALKKLAESALKDRATHADTVARYEQEISNLRKELSAAHEALDANSTPDSVRYDINRMFTR